jgi:uncharacterized membrane protein
MESKAKLLGHPIHQMLVVVPLGAFIGAVLFDAVSLWRESRILGEVGYWNIALGIVGGLLAAVFGFVDWLAIPVGTRAKRIGLIHGGSNVVVVALFTFVWLVRSPGLDPTPTPMLFGIELVALGIATVSGWLGGELVDRLGVGVDDGAHLNAPSSLKSGSARPA